MDKIKNFFFNKIEKGKPTSFSELITSFALGTGKIFILLMLNGVVINLIMPNNSNNKYFLFFQIISITIFLSILFYILINRIPNQFRIIKNYLNTNKHKNSEVSKVMITEKITNSENLNFDNFKEQIYFKNGKKDVHYTFEQLKIKGNLYTTDLIWFEGLKNWTKVIEISELSHIALTKPPLTEKEKNIMGFKNSIKPSIIFYIIFSLLLGTSSGFLEKYQYDIFIDEINNNHKQNIEREDEIKRKNQKFISEFGEKSSFNFNESRTDLSSYSDMPSNEVYATNKDGSRFTRWKSVLAIRGTDQEQISYNHAHKVLFRPYQAIIEHANLSKEERENISLLLLNFVLSALVTNILLIPFIVFVYFLKNKKLL
jgi:hypothetical protein